MRNDEGPRALNVYLDSQDFSRFADPWRTESQETYQRLLDATKAGKIVCRFSAIHIMEALHISADDKKHALRRAEVIRNLCGSHCLLFWQDLVVAEAEAVISEVSFTKSKALLDNGQWAAIPQFDPKAFRRDFQDALKKQKNEINSQLIQANVSRSERRRRLADVKAGKLPGTSLEATEALMKNGMNDLSDDAKRLMDHVSPRDMHALLRGRGSLGGVREGLSSVLLDLPTFFNRHYDGAVGLQQAFGMLRRIGADISRATLEARTAMDEMADLSGPQAAKAKARHSLKKFQQKTREKILKRIWEVEGLKSKGISFAVWEASVIASKPGAIPSVDALVEGLSIHLQRYASAGANRNLEDSDFGDMFHMIYMPYVDAFRCDVNAKQVAAPIAKRLGVRLLSRPRDLDALLAELNP